MLLVLKFVKILPSLVWIELIPIMFLLVLNKNINWNVQFKL